MSRTAEYRIANADIELQVVANCGPWDAWRVAVAVVPGLSETADDWCDLLQNLLPLPAAAVTLRGRGVSSRPASSYSLADHASDIAALVEHLSASAVVLVAFSRSVAYALEYAASQPPKLAGLVLLDYPPKHTALRPGWSSSFAKSEWRGRRVDSVVPLSVLKAIEDAATPKDFASQLALLTMPVLVVRGGAKGAALSAADLAVYQSQVPHCQSVLLPDAGHALWEPYPNALHEAIIQFANGLAGAA